MAEEQAERVPRHVRFGGIFRLFGFNQISISQRPYHTHTCLGGICEVGGEPPGGRERDGALLYFFSGSVACGNL